MALAEPVVVAQVGQPVAVGDEDCFHAVAELVQRPVPARIAADGAAAVVVVVEAALKEVRPVVDVDGGDVQLRGLGNVCSQFAGEIITDSGEAFEEVVSAEERGPFALETGAVDVPQGPALRQIPADDEDFFTIRANFKSIGILLLNLFF